MSEPHLISKNMNNIDTKKSSVSSLHKIDLSKLDASEESMSSFTYPKEFLKLDLDKIREFIEILEEHYQNMIEQQNIGQAKAAKQRLILLKNLEKEKMKKEAKIIYSNQRELIQDKMKEELDSYNETASKEYDSLLKAFEKHEVELLKAQKQEMDEFKKNFDYIYESRRPKPSSEMLNWVKKRDYAVKQNKFYKVEEMEKEINELQKKEDEKFAKDKDKVLKEEIKKLLKNQEDEKNSLQKRKNNLIDMFNKTKDKNINKIKKKYETKMKELKNYQSFEMASFDKITKGITKPSSRIQNIVNSTAKVGEDDSEDIEKLNNKKENHLNEQGQKKSDIKSVEEPEKKEENEEVEEENNVNKVNDNEKDDNNIDNIEGEKQPLKEEDKNEFHYEDQHNGEKDELDKNSYVNENNK